MAKVRVCIENRRTFRIAENLVQWLNLLETGKSSRCNFVLPLAYRRTSSSRTRLISLALAETHVILPSEGPSFRMRPATLGFEVSA